MLHVYRALCGRTAGVVPMKRCNHYGPMANIKVQPALKQQLEQRREAEVALTKIKSEHHCVLEVHDARIPATGRSAIVREVLTAAGRIPYVLVLNKKDLISERMHENIRKYLRKAEGIQHVCFTNCLEKRSSVRRIMPMLSELLLSTYVSVPTPRSFNVLIIGAPRSGKDTLLQSLNCNHLYRSNGQPPQLQELIAQRKHILCANPLIYADRMSVTLSPLANTAQGVMKLNILGYRRSRNIDSEFLCEYLLSMLNSGKHMNYLHVMGMDRATPNIRHVLRAYCRRQKLFVKEELRDGGVVQCPDYRLAAEHMLASFRSGALGNVCLDQEHFIRADM